MKKLILVAGVFALAATLLCAATAGAASFQNGSFEGLVLTGNVLDDGLLTVTNPDASTIPSWSVGGPSGGSVDWVSYLLWTPQDGEDSIDLSGTFGNMNWISQAFDTVAGQSYQVTFWMAGNFIGTTVPKSMLVTAGSFSQEYTEDYAPMVFNGSFYEPAWSQQTFQFKATGSLTTLKFADTSGNDMEGVIVDNVSVTAVPEPSSIIALIGGLGSLLAFRRRRA